MTKKTAYLYQFQVDMDDTVVEFMWRLCSLPCELAIMT